MPVTRREFLLQTGQACLGYALGAAAFAAGVQRFSIINALAQGSDYKALVCVFLAGGNDGNNTIVPLSTSDYQAYSQVRSASGLAIGRDTLLSITPPSIGSPFGLHPSLSELQALWTDQQLAVVANVGPLVQPLTRDEYLQGSPRPYQLSPTLIKSPSGRRRSRTASVRPDGEDERQIGSRHTRPDTRC